MPITSIHAGFVHERIMMSGFCQWLEGNEMDSLLHEHFFQVQSEFFVQNTANKKFSQTTTTVADPKAGAADVLYPLGPISFIFILFSAKNSLGVGVQPCLGNPGSATALQHYLWIS